ncbi:unnamed protein product [Mytilus coruscus]|uniref:Uncharacterized protein n=1 Tax=Mytilus coruscus TaxID=42192 RepID=A0A6J8AZV4_MYTCO|nr:unnamed protein product [Mytilus coruscus]
MNSLYSSMQQIHGILTQVFPNYLKKYPATNRDLNYEAFNNNKNIPYIRIQFLKGNTIGLDLLEEITNQTKALARYFLKATDETDENFRKVEIELLTVQNVLSTFTQQIQQIESNQKICSNAIAEAKEDIAGLTDKTTSGVFWVSAESTEMLETSISNLAIDINTIGKTAKETLFRTLKWIASLQAQWLLVVGNVDADELFGNTKELLLGSWKRNTYGHILITSRREPKQVYRLTNKAYT